MTPLLAQATQIDTVPISITVVIGVASAIVSALATVIVYLERRNAALLKALAKAEEGRLEDIRASGAAATAVLERVLPVLERVAVETRLKNERAARRQGLEDSDPPRPSASSDELAETVARVRRAEEAAEQERRKLSALATGDWPGGGGKAP